MWKKKKKKKKKYTIGRYGIYRFCLPVGVATHTNFDIIRLRAEDTMEQLQSNRVLDPYVKDMIKTVSLALNISLLSMNTKDLKEMQLHQYSMPKLEYIYHT
jgi:hypothetical protein